MRIAVIDLPRPGPPDCRTRASARASPGRLCGYMRLRCSAAFGLALTMSAYSEELRATWLSVVFAGILLLSALKWRKFVLHRMRVFPVRVFFSLYARIVVVDEEP